MPVKYNGRVLIDLENLKESPEVLDEALRIGNEIADVARGLAAKRTGALAAGIHAEVARDPILGLHVRVTWQKDQWYGWLIEAGHDGPGGQPRPFLRPAAAPYVDAHPSF